MHRSLVLPIFLAPFAFACVSTDLPDPGVEQTPNDTGNNNNIGNNNNTGNNNNNTGNNNNNGNEMMNPPLIVAAGDVSGMWCGEVEVTGEVTVSAGARLGICAGSHIAFAPNARMNVLGTLALEASMAEPVTMDSTGTWRGLSIGNGGSLSGGGLSISKGTTCLVGQAGSEIDLEGSFFADCQQSMALANGGTFSQTTILGGITVEITGGVLTMTDSVLDLRHPVLAPDCTDWAGGGTVLDHVRFTGCHCPLHFNRTDREVTVTNSIFDAAGNSVMIAGSNATFTGNHFESTSAEFLDIGGNINANVAGNYWGGGAPAISTRSLAQFTGVDDYLTQPIEGVGPR